MLRRARRNNCDSEVLRIIHIITKELRVIYADLFTGDEDDKLSKTKIK
jgi:hypothetical protein